MYRIEAEIVRSTTTAIAMLKSNCTIRPNVHRLNIIVRINLYEFSIDLETFPCLICSQV